jgi:hypothetical protein
MRNYDGFFAELHAKLVLQVLLHTAETQCDDFFCYLLKHQSFKFQLAFACRSCSGLRGTRPGDFLRSKRGEAERLGERMGVRPHVCAPSEEFRLVKFRQVF